MSRRCACMAADAGFTLELVGSTGLRVIKSVCARCQLSGHGSTGSLNGRIHRRFHALISQNMSHRCSLLVLIYGSTSPYSWRCYEAKTEALCFAPAMMDARPAFEAKVANSGFKRSRIELFKIRASQIKHTFQHAGFKLAQCIERRRVCAALQLELPQASRRQATYVGSVVPSTYRTT